MGNCSCSNEKENQKDDIKYDLERYSYLSKKYKSNENLLKQLIKVQSYIRGMITRLKVKKTRNIYNNISIIYDTDNELSRFIELEKCVLSEKDLLNTINSYPIMTEKYEVEIRPPVEYEDGSVFYGEWMKGTKNRHGRGIQLWEDGTRYEGYFQFNKANLKGKLIHSDGDVYEGNWLNGKAEGYGVYKHIDGSVYRGNWKQDKQNGKGQENWPDDSYYKGEYFMGKKQGEGQFYWADGSTYEGEFENNLIEGKGKSIYFLYEYALYYMLKELTDGVMEESTTAHGRTTK